MFKYLWIVILGIVALILVGVAVADIVKCSKKNYNYYIKQGKGDWKDMFMETLIDLEEYTWGFLIVVFIGITLVSFLMFALSKGGAE